MIQAVIKENGFTLIEVLVALTVLAIALAALIFSSQETTKNTAYLVDKNIAHWVAMDIASEVHLGLLTLPPAPQKKEGNTQALGRIWRWSAQLELSQDPEIWRVIVTVGHDKKAVLVEHIAFLRKPQT